MLEIKLDGPWDATIRGLEELGSPEDRRRLLAELSSMQIGNIKARVRRREGHDGRTYPASRRAVYQNGETLNDRGHMLGAIHVSEVTSEHATITIGSAVEAKKAVWAQEGTPRHFIGPKSKKALSWFPLGSRTPAFSRGHEHPGTPRRPFWGISPSDEKKLVDHALAFIDRNLKRLGLR